MSVSLTNCTVTHRDGRVTQLDQVRGGAFCSQGLSADLAPSHRSTSEEPPSGSTSFPICSRRRPCAFHRRSRQGSELS